MNDSTAWRGVARRMTIGLAALAVALASIAHAEPRLVLGTWNIEHLAAHNGTGCRPRSDAEYRAIRTYVRASRADILAFQEVENSQAAERVFPDSDYALHISRRPSVDLGDCYDADSKRMMQRTGFAVRKDIGRRLGLRVDRRADVTELERGGHGARWAVHLVLDTPSARDASRAVNLHLLSIHLKSGCAYDTLATSKRGACRTLAKQIPVLARWIRARANAREDFVILGDFNRQLDQLSDDLWVRLESGSGAQPYVDLEKALHGIKHPKPHNERYPYAVDHIVYNRAVDGVVLEDTAFFDVGAAAFSDHPPLFMTIDLSGL